MGSEWINNGGTGIGVGNHRLTSVIESPLSLSPKMFQISSPSNSSSSSPSSPYSGSAGSVIVGVGVGGSSYIEHHVSRYDTLAGVAIKYGVEVADIKKINGLVTDLQMFARKTLYIPLPGRHPPSPIIANGFDAQGASSYEQTPPPRRRHSDFLDSFQSLKLTSSSKRQVSPAVNNLQGYYGLKPPDQRTSPGGSEMTVYQNGGSQYLEDGSSQKLSPQINPSFGMHRKSKSVNYFNLENGDLANGVSVETAGEADSDNWVSNLVRRRQKSEADFNSRAPEMLLKGETGSGGFSPIRSKGLALRPKAASRTVSGVDGETGLQNSVSTAVGEFSLIDSLCGVKKSSSTPSFRDSDNCSSIWPTVNWSLKPDLRALSSTVAITRPIFDGLPKPITSRRNKTAVD